MKVLCQLMENFQIRPTLLKDDGLPLIIKLLDSEYAIIQELALQTLHSCMHHSQLHAYTNVCLTMIYNTLIY